MFESWTGNSQPASICCQLARVHITNKFLISYKEISVTFFFYPLLSPTKSWLCDLRYKFWPATLSQDSQSVISFSLSRLIECRRILTYHRILFFILLLKKKENSLSNHRHHPSYCKNKCNEHVSSLLMFLYTTNVLVKLMSSASSTRIDITQQLATKLLYSPSRVYIYRQPHEPKDTLTYYWASPSSCNPFASCVFPPRMHQLENPRTCSTPSPSLFTPCEALSLASAWSRRGPYRKKRILRCCCKKKGSQETSLLSPSHRLDLVCWARSQHVGHWATHLSAYKRILTISWIMEGRGDRDDVWRGSGKAANLG